MTRLLDAARSLARSKVFFYGGVVILHAAVFVPMGVLRLVDADEGAYLLAARLVMEGKLPYHDFSFAQTPIIPYLYGVWMALLGRSWYSARLFAALLSIVLGLLLSAHVSQVTRRRLWGGVAALVFAFSGLAFAWYPVVKTLGVGTLLLFASYAVLFTASRWKYFLSGLSLGLAVDTRLYLAVIIPVVLIHLLTDDTERARRFQVARFVIGLAIAALPSEFFFLIGPDTFVFNILGYQAIRSDYGLIGAFDQKGHVALRLLAINTADGVSSAQFLILLLLNTVLLVSSLLTRRRVPLSASITIVLLFVSFLPTPTYTQYFSIVLPFLIVNATLLLADVARALPQTIASNPSLRYLMIATLAFYVIISPFDMYRFTRGGPGIPGISTPEDSKNWTIPTINAVTRSMDAALPPDRRIAISWWPGYFVETTTEILPKLENHFNLWYAPRLSPEQRERYRYMSSGELEWHVRHHTVPVVVLGNWVIRRDRPWYRNLLVQSGYVLTKKVADAEIYALRPPGGPERPTR